MAIHHNDLVLADSYPLYLIVNQKEEVKEYQGDSQEHEGSKQMLIRSAELKKDGRRYGTLQYAEYKEKVLGEIKLNGTCFYHFSTTFKKFYKNITYLNKNHQYSYQYSNDLTNFYVLCKNDRCSEKFTPPIQQENLVLAKKCKDTGGCLSSSSSSREPDHP